MKKLLLLFFIVACHKQEITKQHLGGTIIDDKINANIVTLQSRVAVNSKKDTDKDGIYDLNDQCPLQPETYNGYLDTDGCPDVIPPVNNADGDNDGIIDINDQCLDQQENYNGFQDTDGCPDVPVITLPPIELPLSAEIKTPIPGDQGNEGSCVPFACTYGARSIEYFYRTGATDYDYSSNVFSPEYTYNQTVFYECATGTGIDPVMQVMIRQGVCTFDKMPYTDTGCSVQPNASQVSDAAAYKISGYAQIVHSDYTAIKQMIYTKHPVIITILADNSFISAEAGFIWRVGVSGVLPHTLLICGYDDNKNAFKVMNSWGVDWCDGGFGWIDYNLYLTKSTYYVYVIQ